MVAFDLEQEKRTLKQVVYRLVYFSLLPLISLSILCYLSCLSGCLSGLFLFVFLIAVSFFHLLPFYHFLSSSYHFFLLSFSFLSIQPYMREVIRMKAGDGGKGEQSRECVGFLEVHP